MKWMALESIGDKIFSTESDVWSFGILLWEIFTMGGTPYPGIEINEVFYKKLKDGYRMEKPEFASEAVYKMMMDCWVAFPKDRPSFSELAHRLGSELESSIKSYYVDLTNMYTAMNQPIKNNNDYLSMTASSVNDYKNVGNAAELNYVNVFGNEVGSSTESNYLSMQSPSTEMSELSVFSFEPDDLKLGKALVNDKPSDVSSGDKVSGRMQPGQEPHLPFVDRTLDSDSVFVDQTSMGSFSPSPLNLRQSNGFLTKTSNDSVTSDSSGFHSDFTENYAPPSYSVVFGLGRKDGVTT